MCLARLHFLFALGMAFPSISEAQLAGRSSFAVLDMVSAPRVAALGGIAPGFDAPEAGLALYNPSLLHASMEGQISLYNLNIQPGIASAEASYVHRFKKVGLVQFGMRYLDYGTFDETDEFGNALGQFGASDQTLLAGWALPIDSHFTVGVQFELIRSVFAEYSAWGAAWDAGITWRKSELLSLSLLIRNAGFQLASYSGQREPLPFEIQFGISNKFAHAPFRWHLALQQLQNWNLAFVNPATGQFDPLTGAFEVDEPSFVDEFLRHVVAGIEFQPSQNFRVGVGYNFRRAAELGLTTRRSSSGLSFGLGLKVFKIDFSYARSVRHVAGGTNQLGITVDLKRYKKADAGQ